MKFAHGKDVGVDAAKNSEQENNEVEILQRVPHPGWMRDNKHSLDKTERLARLDARDEQIRADHEEMFVKSTRKLAKKYDLSHQQISNIISGTRNRQYPRETAKNNDESGGES